MDILQIREKATKMGIEPLSMGKTELIRAIQRAEGNIDCFATARTCGEEKCIWWEYCLKPKISEYELSEETRMKLQAAYWKEANGLIKATLKVVDQGDYPGFNIFKSALENQSDEVWSIGDGIESTISNMLSSPDEAKQWVSAQINAIKGKLDGWRGIRVPEFQEFEI